MIDFNAIPQGWQCPVCQTVHAPFIRFCDVCAKRYGEVERIKPEDTYRWWKRWFDQYSTGTSSFKLPEGTFVIG